MIDLNKNSQSLSGGSAGTPGVRYNYLDKPDLLELLKKGGWNEFDAKEALNRLCSLDVKFIILRNAYCRTIVL